MIFFSEKELVFYNNINDLSEKLNRYKKDLFLGEKIAKAGKKKYFKYFNSDIISDYIVSKILDISPKNKIIW